MKIKYLIIGLVCSTLVACGGGESNHSDTQNEEGSSAESIKVAEENVDPMSNKGIGPVSSVELGEINQEMVTAGEELFKSKCSACHKVGKKYIGPDMAGLLERRTPEWIMNMIMNPDEMVAKDPIARQLLMEYSSPMANQSLTEDETRKILEYFRTI